MLFSKHCVVWKSLVVMQNNVQIGKYVSVRCNNIIFYYLCFTTTYETNHTFIQTDGAELNDNSTYILLCSWSIAKKWIALGMAIFRICHRFHPNPFFHNRRNKQLISRIMCETVLKYIICIKEISVEYMSVLKW